MIEKEFVKKGINHARLEEFLDKELGRANYSHAHIYKTPISTRITIRAQKPGLVIGRGGERIGELVEVLKNSFGIENPVIEAEETENPDLDARIVAKSIAGWLEKGGNPKRIGNTYLKRIMAAGAVGAQIEISGKLSGERHRTEKFIDGYVKRCGGSADQYVSFAKAIARTKPGVMGIKVRIMKDLPEYRYQRKLGSIERMNDEKLEKGGKEVPKTKPVEPKENETGKKIEEKRGKPSGEKKISEEELKTVLNQKIKNIRAFTSDKKAELKKKDFDYLLRKLIKFEESGKSRKTLLDFLNSELSSG